MGLSTELLKNHFYLMRHAEAQSSLQKLLVSRESEEEKLAKTFGLTDQGREQVLTTCEQFWRAGSIWPGLIVTSPLSRCLETAEIVREFVARSVSKEIELLVDKSLSDRYWGSLERAPLSSWEQIFREDLAGVNDSSFGAESVAQMAWRLTQFLKRMDGRHSGANILVVSHADPIQSLFYIFSESGFDHYSRVPEPALAEVRKL